VHAVAPRPLVVTKRRWELGYRSGFDGLRGVAVLLVIGQHAGIPPFESAGNAAGVVAFFVLSGFLITALLLDEVDRTQHIDLVGFYLRRARRLFPALFVLLVAVSFAYAAGGAWSYIVSSVAPALLYVADIARASGNGMWLLGHTWSLAIEEQFYLLWPLALLFVPRRAVVPALLALLPFIVATRLALWQTPQAAYAPYAQADSLVVGCLLAFAIRRGLRLPRSFTLIGAAILVISFVGPQVGALPAQVSISLATGASALMVVAVASAPPQERSWLSWRPLVAVGLVSYGLYLWHFPLIWFARLESVPPVAGALTAFVVAGLSYRWVEMPFRRRAKRSLRAPGRE
jgi:peptidoglycan/LPS O-acetylase OafA/YrhL